MGKSMMHERLIYAYVVRRLRRMTDKELDAVRCDCLFVWKQAMKGFEQQGDWPFGVGFDRRLAKLQTDPQLLSRFEPILEGPGEPRKKRQRHDYFDEAWPNRIAVENRWRAITEKIAKVQFPNCPRWKIEQKVDSAELPKLPGMRVAELVSYAELHAGCHNMGNPKWVDAHLRELEIDALAQFLTLLCDPMAATAEPLKAA